MATSSGNISTLASAIADIIFDSNKLSSFMGVADVAKDSAFSLSNDYTSVKSFGQWMAGDRLLPVTNMTVLAHGINAFIFLDKLGGNLVGLSNYTGLAGGIVNTAKIVQGLHEGDISKVLFFGAKLCAAVAITGNPATVSVFLPPRKCTIGICGDEIRRL